MKKARLHVYDPIRQRRQETIDTIADAMAHAKAHRCDGVFVVLMQGDSSTTIKIGGRMMKKEIALRELSKVAAAYVLGGVD